MKLQQAFYGNDGSGYSLVGISEPAYSDTVESLCGKIGTPDGISEFKPILFSRPIRNILFMGCCRQGEIDHAGRRTIFFHLFFGDAASCTAAGINAWTLFQKNLFEERCPDAIVSELETESIDFREVKLPVPQFSWDGSPLAVQSDHAENALICGLAGKKINSVSWSGFCYRASSDFTLFAVAVSAGIPQDSACCDRSGNKIANEQEHFIPGPQVKSVPTVRVPEKKHSTLSLFFICSLLLNIILILFLVLGHERTESQTVADQNAHAEQIHKLQAENAQLRALTQELRDFRFEEKLKATTDAKNFLSPEAKEIKPKDYQLFIELQELFHKVNNQTKE